MMMMMLLLFSCLSRAALVPTPFGRVPSSCVHSVPSGAVVSVRSGTTFVAHPSLHDGRPRALPRCTTAARQFDPPPNYNGWLAYTSFKTSQPTFDNFLGNFSVPDVPRNMAQALYIFTGLQNVDWVPIVDPPQSPFDIIQPVLQYPADSGSGWSLKSWYVTINSGYLVTDEVPCLPGDVIFGNMTYLAKKFLGGKWYIGGTVVRTGATAALTVERARLKTQPWAYTTVECYGCNDCSYLPRNPLYFTGMTGAYRGSNIPFSWSALVSPNSTCPSTVAHVQGSSAVTYTFQQ